MFNGCCHDRVNVILGGFKILSAKYIAKGGGLDPLKAQRVSTPVEEGSVIEDNLQIVSVRTFILYVHIL